jgi:hypothetical protein
MKVLDKLKLIKLLNRAIAGDKSALEEYLSIKNNLNPKQEELVEEKPAKEEKTLIVEQSQPSKLEFVSLRGEIKDQEEKLVIQKPKSLSDLMESTEQNEEQPKEESKTSFKQMFEEEKIISPSELIQVEEIKETNEEINSINDKDNAINKENEEINKEINEEIKNIIEDKEKDKLIEIILSSKPKKAPDSSYDKPVKLEMSDNEKRAIPEQHKSRFSFLINLISQVIKKIKK